VSALSKNDNKHLCFVVLKFFLLSLENPKFCLVLLHQSWSSVFAPWYPWFNEGLLCAVLHQHPHISTVLYAHEIGNRFHGAKIHISLVFCIELMNHFPNFSSLPRTCSPVVFLPLENPTVLLPGEATPVVASVCDMFIIGRRLVNHSFNSAVFLTDPRLRPKTLFPPSKSNR
jgi:hypothetical protein